MRTVRARPVRRHVARAVVVLVVAAGLSAAGATAGAAHPGHGTTAVPDEHSAQAPVVAAALPAGFSDRAVWSVPAVTDIAPLPDGRILLASQPGQLRVVDATGTLLAAPALDVSAQACTNSERGLLAVTPHPGFATNRWVYVTWTRRTGTGCQGVAATNRVSRFTLGADDRVVAGSEVVVADHLLSPQGNHNAGDLAFGADGLLYVSTGDGGCQLTAPTRCGNLNANARRLDIPLGKLLRLKPDGTVPTSNPYSTAPGARRCTRPSGPDAGTGPCRETFASGLRNPFRMAVRPGTSTVWLNDVGQTSWEEVDVAVAGADYGWNLCEGTHVTGTSQPCAAAGVTAPLLEYSHAAGCTSITGGAFLPSTMWGALGGSYLFADYVCGSIFRRDGAGNVTTFASGLDSPVAMAVGPKPGGGKALYWSSFGSGTVHRVTATTANTPPTAVVSALPDDADPQVVDLDGSRSSDPDGGDRIVSWRWTFGDGTTATTTAPTVQHRYAGTAPRTASLVVVDSRGAASASASVRVVPGDRLPVVTIAGADATYGVGERVTLSATATDPEDGPLPGSAITWLVQYHHDTHVHPRLGPVTGTTVRTPYPAPEDVPSTTDSWLDVTVTATDSAGFARVEHRRVLPALVPVTLAGVPSGTTVFVNGYARVTPATITSWRGWGLALDALDQPVGGAPYRCTGWSDGGACAHDTVTPATPLTLTATFTPR